MPCDPSQVRTRSWIDINNASVLMTGLVAGCSALTNLEVCTSENIESMDVDATDESAAIII